MSEEQDILAFARECAGNEALSVRQALEWLVGQRKDMTRSMVTWRDLCRQREIQLGIKTTETGDNDLPKF